MNILGSTYLTTKKHIAPITRAHRQKSRQVQLAEKFLEEWEAHTQIDSEHLLKDTLAFAADNIPYYRRYFSLHSDKNPARLEDWPVLTRDDLWDESASLQRMDSSPWNTWTHASGGSTGKPVTVVHDEYFAAKAEALRQLCGRLFFQGPHYNKLILWGMSKEVSSQNRSLKQRLLDYGRHVMGLKTSHINTFEFTQEKFAECVRILRRQKPRFIFGYAGSIYELAKYLDETGVKLPKTPQMIGTTAQTLHPFMRDRIEKVFGCRVCDHYGSREVGPVAWQHNSGDMYFPKFFSKVEVVDDQGNPVAPGEQGRILVTTLQNHTMPLIRYDIGDTGTLGEDVDYCGYPFSTLKAINGRQSEEFTNIRGSRICAPFFINLFYYRPWLDRFYIVQRDLRLVEILYVPKQQDVEACSQAHMNSEMAEISSKIQTVMTEECEVRWTQVDEVPTTKSGKRLFIRSEVK